MPAKLVCSKVITNMTSTKSEMKAHCAICKKITTDSMVSLLDKDAKHPCVTKMLDGRTERLCCATNAYDREGGSA